MKLRLSKPGIVCLAYFFLHTLAHFSAKYFEVSPGISIWYAPAGLALSLLVLLGVSYWPVVFLTNTVVALASARSYVWWSPIVFPALITAGYAAAAAVLRRVKGPFLFPETKRGILAYILGSVAAPALVAFPGTAILILLKLADASTFWQASFQWWLGDISGVITVAPVALVFAAPWLMESRRFSLSFLRDKGLVGISLFQGLSILICLGLVFALEPLRGLNALYICFIPLIWIALVHGVTGATLATLVTTMGGLLGMHYINPSQGMVINFFLFEVAAAAVGLGLGSAVTYRTRAEAETKRLLQVIEANTDYVVTTDRQGHILYANRAFQRLAGVAIRSLNLLDCLNEKHRNLLASVAIPAATFEGSWQGEVTLMPGPNREIPVSVVILVHDSKSPDTLSLSYVMRDISSQRQAEAERMDGERKMLQAQKLEGLGVLAGGIAHDFNNLLTVMLGNASLARLELPTNSKVHASLTQIETAAASAAELCRQMLAYAGRSPLAFTEVDITQLIENTTHLIQITLGKKHHLVLDLARSIPSIQADATQIRQIVMNMTLNGSQAIGEREGRITIRTSSKEFSARELSREYSDSNLEAGTYVMLEVEDTGCGMPEEIVGRVFEPFFTTKFAGHGLGLAAVLGIVKSHNGGIRVRSEQGKGTVFNVIFPAIGYGEAPRQARKSTLKPWQGTGVVLVIDDEANVRNTIVNALASLGFTALVASDGSEGIEIFRKNSSTIRFVMLDLIMPRLGGEETFLALHAISPDVPVILMSGFNENQSLSRFVDPKPAAFIAKPFTHQTLNTCLRQLSHPKEL